MRVLKSSESADFYKKKWTDILVDIQEQQYLLYLLTISNKLNVYNAYNKIIPFHCFISMTNKRRPTEHQHNGILFTMKTILSQ